MDLVRLGLTDVLISRLGIGTWAWGDRRVWAYGEGFGEGDVAGAFGAGLKAGVNFVDTAEMYGDGLSEELVGRFAGGSRVVVATKFLPLRGRGPESLPEALEGSLARLKRSSVELYQVHWPEPWMPIPAVMDRLADSVEAGKARAVGVSNYSARQMRTAHRALAQRGVPLASNQVEYSLLKRTPEVNGVMETCRELGVTLVAYSPLALGALCGKYSRGAKPPGARRMRGYFRGRALDRSGRVVGLLEAIGERHGRSPAQVALRWLMQQEGVVPIPGAKNAEQSAENAGALHFRLRMDEWDEIDRATRAWRK